MAGSGDAADCVGCGGRYSGGQVLIGRVTAVILRADDVDARSIDAIGLLDDARTEDEAMVIDVSVKSKDKDEIVPREYL